MTTATHWSLEFEKPDFSCHIVPETGMVGVRQSVHGQSLAVYGTPEALQEWLDELVAVTQPTIEEAKARAAERGVRA